MVISSVTVTPADVLLVLRADEGGEESLTLSPGEWKRVNRFLGYDPDAGLFLAPGTPADETVYDRLKEAAERTGALRTAARLLAAGDLSASFLARRLTNRGFSAEAARSAVLRLEKKGLLDEGAACERIAERLLLQKRYGPRRILAYLLSRGYPREAAKNASDALDRDEIRAALREQLLKKYPAVGEAGRDGMTKAVAALMRLGFAPDDIRAAIRETDRT